MKKIIYALLFVLIANVNAMAQTSLPTSWNFATATLPSGWTSSGSGFTYYAASGNPAPAAKFAATGDKLIINFASSPGNLTYDLTGNSFSGGTFLVEESVNGTTYTTLRTFTAPPAGTYTPFTDVPNSASRYIRFNYSNKVSGNIGVDNVNITAGVSTTQQIIVKQGTTTIVNGGTYALSSAVFTMTPTTFTVYNLGTVGTLNISSVTITGSAAADFSVASFPASVAPLGNGSLVVNFTPSVAGTRMAALNIVNDDPTGSPYVINLFGVGGSYATEPSTSATSLVFSGIKSYRFNASFTTASPAVDGYIVLRRTGSVITDIPLDGTVYQRGDVIGNSKVVFSSTATAFYPNEIVANTTYYFAVFSFNGPGIYRNYKTTSPLVGNVTSAPSMQPGTYYSTVSTSSASFVTQLHSKINPHSMEFYSSYGPLMVTGFAARDTTGNQRVITCVYSGENKIYTEPFDWTTNNFSREHTYCNSWQPTTNNIPDNTNLPEYNDYHMLTPTNQTLVNAVRSNYPLGEVTGTVISSYLGSKIGYNAAGKKVFEPRDADKGDAARCMMYEAICYTGVAYTGPANTNCVYGGSWALPSYISGSIPYGQDQNILKKWHYQDPPDNFEIARNDYVDSLQGNRNPFIDSVQFVCYIDFMTMTKIAGPNIPCNAEVLGINENTSNDDLIALAPNPNNGIFTINYTATKNQNLKITLIDLMGRIIYSNESKIFSGNNILEIKIENLSGGIYSLEFVTDSGRKTEKLVIQ